MYIRIVIYSFFILLSMKNIDFLKKSLIAHRGVHNSKIIENTIPAFYKCVHKKYIIELDIHILMDNEIVIYHDFNIKRLTGVNKTIEKLSYAQLSKIKIKNKYTIPTLKQVMHIVKEKVPLLIEIKKLNDNYNLERELVKILDNYRGEFAIQSSNIGSLMWLKKNRPNYIYGLIIFSNIDYKINKKYIKYMDFLTVNKYLNIKIKNKLLLGWTIKSKEEYCKYKDKFDNLICEKFI